VQVGSAKTGAAEAARRAASRIFFMRENSSCI